jgi:hypothetical protein
MKKQLLRAALSFAILGVCVMPMSVDGQIVGGTIGGMLDLEGETLMIRHQVAVNHSHALGLRPSSSPNSSDPLVVFVSPQDYAMSKGLAGSLGISYVDQSGVAMVMNSKIEKRAGYDFVALETTDGPQVVISDTVRSKISNGADLRSK